VRVYAALSKKKRKKEKKEDMYRINLFAFIYSTLTLSHPPSLSLSLSLFLSAFFHGHAELSSPMAKRRLDRSGATQTRSAPESGVLILLETLNSRRVKFRLKFRSKFQPKCRRDYRRKSPRGVCAFVMPLTRFPKRAARKTLQRRSKFAGPCRACIKARPSPYACRG